MRKKDKSEVEHFRGIIRELEKENRALKKQLKQLEKREHQYEEREQDEELVADSEDTKVSLCKECGRGIMSTLDLGKFVYKVCQVCDHKERI